MNEITIEFNLELSLGMPLDSQDFLQGPTLWLDYQEKLKVGQHPYVALRPPYNCH